MENVRTPSGAVALPEVRWTSPPLGCVEFSRTWMESRFGEPHHVDLDSNGIGLFDAWLMRFECGLEVALWLFHQRPDFSYIEHPDEPAIVEIHANELERGHVFFHLGVDRQSVSSFEPDRARDGPLAWTVRRLDDNGNEYDITRVTSRCEAAAITREYEARGHKQTYWVVGPDDGGSADRGGRMLTT